VRNSGAFLNDCCGVVLPALAKRLHKLRCDKAHRCLAASVRVPINQCAPPRGLLSYFAARQYRRPHRHLVTPKYLACHNPPIPVYPMHRRSPPHDNAVSTIPQAAYCPPRDPVMMNLGNSRQTDRFPVACGRGCGQFLLWRPPNSRIPRGPIGRAAGDGARPTLREWKAARAFGDLWTTSREYIATLKFNASLLEEAARKKSGGVRRAHSLHRR
jgi:hypothetical protein